MTFNQVKKCYKAFDANVNACMHLLLNSVKSKWPCQRSSTNSSSGVEEVASPLEVVGEEVSAVYVDAILLVSPGTLN